VVPVARTSLLLARGSKHEAGKLADWESFTTRMRLDDAPAAPRTVIDSRLTSSTSLEEQLAFW
jgi:hypothetical protein